MFNPQWLSSPGWNLPVGLYFTRHCLCTQPGVHGRHSDPRRCCVAFIALYVAFVSNGHGFAPSCPWLTFFLSKRQFTSSLPVYFYTSLKASLSYTVKPCLKNLRLVVESLPALSLALPSILSTLVMKTCLYKYRRHGLLASPRERSLQLLPVSIS